MGLILDLAVVAIAVVVAGSLALLAWTLAVSAVRAVRVERTRVAFLRRSLADGEDRLRTDAPRLAATLSSLANRTKPIPASDPGDPSDR